MNPHATNDTTVGRREVYAIERATVTNSPATTTPDGSPLAVDVRPFTLTESVTASVSVNSNGDAWLPQEGDTVIIGYRANGRAVVLNAEYGENDTPPDVAPGERRISHPLSDSHVQFNADGSVDVVGPSGSSVTLNGDGSVSVNGGSTNPVTDVSVSTDVDGDGHVTDVSLSMTRASNVTVPDS